MQRRSNKRLVLVFAAAAALAAVAAGVVHVVNRRTGTRHRIGDTRNIGAALQEYLKNGGRPAAPTAAEKPAAETAALGRVEIARKIVGLRDSHQPRWVLARPDAAIEPDRILRVGDDPSACARVQLADAIEISVNSTSTVEFIAKDHVAVRAGDAHFLVRKGTPLAVDAPGCSIRVKGTEFSVTALPGRTVLAVTAGTVEMAALGKTFDVAAGKACTLADDTISWDDRAEAPAWLAKFEQLPAEESLGRLVAKIDGKDVPLAVRSHTVNVTIRDQIACTQIEEEFENNTASRLEGTFYYPLPADASISRFAMWVGDVLMEGEVVERMRAREVYESIVRRKRDPALLEWMGGNQFKARVFPIEPNSTKRVILGYTQVLPLEGDTVRYTYPLKSEKLTKNPLRRLQIELSAWSTPAIAGFDSPSHVCGLTAGDHYGRAIFQAENYLPTRDFIVAWQVAGKQAELYCVPHWRDDEHGYFLAFVSPREIGAAEDSAKDKAAEDVLLMLDTSASVAGDDWKAAKRVAATWLNFLGERDRFNLVLFDLEPRPAFPQFVQNTPENRRLAGELLDDVEPFGASDVARAIASATYLLTAREGEITPARIVFIGDGVSTIGETEPARLLATAADAFKGIGLTVSTVAIGSEYDAAFIEGFARQFDGTAKVLSSSQPIEQTVAEMVDDSFKPMITNLTLSFEGVEVSRVFPATLPNVLAGGQVIVAGRYDKPGTGRMVLAGLCGDAAYRREIEVTLGSEKNENTFVPRLWARRCMDDMLHRIGRGEQSLVKDVIDLSLAYKLMSPYTSFLVLETEDDYRRFGIDRRFSMEQWTGGPAGPEAPAEGLEMAAAKPEAQMQIDRKVGSMASPMPYYAMRIAGFEGEGGFDDYIGEEELSSEMDAAFNDAEWAQAGDMQFAANQPMDMRMRLDSPLSMDMVMPSSSLALSRLEMFPAAGGGSFGGYAGRAKSNWSHPGRGRRSNVLYPASEPRQQAPQQQPPQPAIDADVRAALETFAKGPADFRFRSITTSYAKNGRVESSSESTRALIAKRFVREYSSEGEITSRTLCDGDLVYTCYSHTRYAAARKATDDDFRVRDLPGNSDATPEQLVGQGTARIESREGDVVVVCVDSQNSRARHFVDVAKKALLKTDHYQRRQSMGSWNVTQAAEANPPAEGEFRLTGRTEFDEHKAFGERVVPLRQRHFNAEGVLTSEIKYEEMQVGQIDAEIQFAPPADWLVVTYPLPKLSDARRRVDEVERATGLLTGREHLVLALVLEQAGKFAEAAKTVERLMEIRKDDPYLVLFHGWLRACDGDRQALIDAAAKAAKMKDVQQNYRVVRAVADVLGQAGMHKERKPYVQMLFDLAPRKGYDPVNWCSELARAHRDSGDPAKAREVWQKLLAEMPDYGYAWSQAAQFYAGDPETADEAEAAYLKARELGYNVDSPLASFYRNRGEYDKAITEYRRSLDADYVDSWRVREMLSMTDEIAGGEAALKEAESLLAAQRDQQKRKQIALGCVYYLRDSERPGTGAPEFIKRLGEAFLDDTDVLREVLQMRQYGGTVLFDPMPEIEKRFAGPPADYGQALWRVKAIGSMASGGDYRDAALRLLVALPKPGIEMTEQQRLDYAYQLATASLRVRSDDAIAACERVLKMEFPDGDYRPRDIRHQLVDILIENEPDKAVAKLVESLKTDRDDGNRSYTIQRVIRRLAERKNADALLSLYSAIREAMPEQDYYCRIQIALLKAEQKKTQEAYDELWPVLSDTDAAVAAPEAGDDEPGADAAYYFHHAGRALVRVTAKNDGLKAKLDATVAERAGAENVDGDARWSSLHADLLRARGKFTELIALLRKLSARKDDGDAWARRLAGVFAGTRRYEDAVGIYRKLVEKDPGDFPALMELCKLAAAMRQPTQEQEYWQAFLKAVPDDESYLGQLARQLSQSGQTARAIGVYEKLLAISGWRANDLSQEYQKLGRKLDAALTYVKATRPGNRNRSTDHNWFGQVWPLITEEGAFDKFAAAVEQEIEATADGPHRARLMGLLADINAKRGDKPKAASWALKAISDPVAAGEAAFDAALPFYTNSATDANAADVLRRAIADLQAAGKPEPEWLRVRLARELFAGGEPGEGERILRAIIEKARPQQRAAMLVELGDQLGKTEPARAVAIYDEVAANANTNTVRTALLRKAELLASVKDAPADDVLAAYRAAANLGNADIRRQAIEPMLKFATDRKLHDAVIEANRMACRYERWGAGGRIRHLAEYLRSQKLDDRVEPAVRACIGELTYIRNAHDVWRQFGNMFAGTRDPAKAVAIWAEGLRQPSLRSGSSYGRDELIGAIRGTVLDRRNREKIDRAMIVKLLEEEVDRFAKEPPASSDWTSAFWRLAREVDMVDALLARLKESPAGRKTLGNAYQRIGESYHEDGKEQRDKALEYYKMALNAGDLTSRDSLLSSMMGIYRERQEWQNAMDAIDQVKDDAGYQRQMHRGFCLAKLGRMEEAAEAYEKEMEVQAQRSRGSDYHRFREIGRSAREAGLYDFAIKTLNQAIRQHDIQRRGRQSRDENHLLECHRELARCYQGKGETEKAIDQLLVGQSRVGASRGNQIHRDLLEMFKDDAALSAYVAKYEQEAAETKLEKPGLRAMFGDVFREKQKWDEALRHYQAALDTAPNRGDIRERTVEILRQQNRRDDLIAQYREWAKFDPKNIQHYRQLGQLLSDAGRDADAMRAYSTMLEAMPTEADSHREMAGVYTRAKRFPEAIAMWKKVVEYRPEEPESHYGLAQSYGANGQLDDANAVYESMLAKTWDERFGDVMGQVRRRMMNDE